MGILEELLILGVSNSGDEGLFVALTLHTSLLI
jgi:hypothetical protein